MEGKGKHIHGHENADLVEASFRYAAPNAYNHLEQHSRIDEEVRRHAAATACVVIGGGKGVKAADWFVFFFSYFVLQISFPTVCSSATSFRN